jgi:CRISPR/Cas system-associated protein Cas10 (large subunit of type III CRISPR-Cas system)
MTKLKKESTISLSLTKDEIKLILESLLFSSSVDVCASWYQEDTKDMLNLAEKIRHKISNVPLENIYMTHFSEDDELFMDKHSQTIIKNFPELERIEKQNI